MPPKVAPDKAMRIIREAGPDSTLRLNLFVPAAADNRAGNRGQWAAYSPDLVREEIDERASPRPPAGCHHAQGLPYGEPVNTNGET
jgi:hypothetical protein